MAFDYLSLKPITGAKNLLKISLAFWFTKKASFNIVLDKNSLPALT